MTEELKGEDLKVLFWWPSVTCLKDWNKENTAAKEGPAPALLEELRPVGTNSLCLQQMKIWLMSLYLNAIWRLNSSHLIRWAAHTRNQTSVMQTAGCGLFHFDASYTECTVLDRKMCLRETYRRWAARKGKATLSCSLTLRICNFNLKLPHVQWRKIQTHRHN